MLTIEILVNGTAQPVKVQTQKGKAALKKATAFNVVTVLAGKDVLTAHAERINHYSAHMGVVCSVSENGDGEAVFTVQGVPQGLAENWVWIVARLAGRQAQIKDTIKTYTRPSEVRKQFLKQFLPSLTTNGSAIARDSLKADLENCKEYMDWIEPIFAQAGLI